MDVFWLEQTEADVPSEHDWLSASEAVRLNGMRFAKRHADWRLGRWTAKRAVAAYLHVPSHLSALASIEIRPAPSGAPEVFLADKKTAVTISLSHRAGRAACAVAPSKVALGCDVEAVEPRGDAFVADYFAAEELALVAGVAAADRPGLLALLWSGKESALKALHAGLRLDARTVSVNPGDVPSLQGIEGDERTERRALSFRPPSGLKLWCPLQVRYTSGHVFHGWWHQRDNLVRTVVAAPPPRAPIPLTVSSLFGLANLSS